MRIEIREPITVIIKRHTCPFHLKYPFATYAGCTCSIDYIGKENKQDLFKKSRKDNNV